MAPDPAAAPARPPGISQQADRVAGKISEQADEVAGEISEHADAAAEASEHPP